MNIGPESPRMIQLLGKNNVPSIAATICYLMIYVMARLAQIAAILDHLMGAVIGRDFAAGCGKIAIQREDLPTGEEKTSKKNRKQ